MRFAHRPSPFGRPGAGCRLGLNAMPGALRLRPTKLPDLDFVAAVEADAHNRPFIERAIWSWARTSSLRSGL